MSDFTIIIVECTVHYNIVTVIYNMTVSEKTDHLAPMQFVQYGPKVLQKSRSRDFTITIVYTQIEWLKSISTVRWHQNVFNIVIL